MTTYYANGERLIYPFLCPTLYFDGSGHYVTIDSNMTVWTAPGDQISQVAVFATDRCIPDIDKIKYFNQTRNYIKLLENSGDAASMIVGALTADIYTIQKIFYDGWIVDGFQNSWAPPNFLFGSVNTEYYEYNSYYGDGSSPYAL